MTLKVVMHLMRHKTRVARVSFKFCQLFSSPFKLSPSHPRRHPRVLRAGADVHGQINLLALSNSMIARAYGNGLTHWHPNGSQAAASRARVWQMVATASRTATRSHSSEKTATPGRVARRRRRRGVRVGRYAQRSWAEHCRRLRRASFLPPAAAANGNYSLRDAGRFTQRPLRPAVFLICHRGGRQ